MPSISLPGAIRVAWLSSTSPIPALETSEMFDSGRGKLERAKVADGIGGACADEEMRMSGSRKLK